MSWPPERDFPRPPKERTDDDALATLYATVDGRDKGDAKCDAIAF